MKRLVVWCSIALLVAGSGCKKKEGGTEAPPATAAPAAPAQAAKTPAATPAPAADAGAVAAAPDGAAPAPPSTGREMPSAEPVAPALTPEQAKQMIGAAVEEYAKPAGARDCGGIIQVLIPALQLVAPNPTAEVWPAYEALQSCLHTVGAWATLLQVSYAMLDAVPDKARPYFLARALIGLGRLEQAGQAIQELAGKFPDDVELATAAGFLTCAAKQWEACLQVAGATLEHADEVQDEDVKRDVLVRTHYFRLQALYHLHRLDEADGAVTEMDKIFPGDPLVTYLKQQLALARATGMAVDWVCQAPIPLGAYHLFSATPGAVAGPLCKFSLTSFAETDRQLHLEVEIQGLSDRTSQTVMLLRAGAQDVLLVPPLKFDFDVAGLRAEREAQLAWKITAIEETGERVLYDETVAVKVLPRDSLVLERKISTDVVVPAYENIGAWITPNARAVEQFLTAAKTRAPGATFAGEQTETGPQVEAIWNELQSRGVSYVMDPSLFAGAATIQRTRLPSEVLASTNAQCLEGTILFASLMEAIGLRPIIVLVPGHAFVGWHGTAADGVEAGTPIFVETTMVHDAKFLDAVKVAMARVVEEQGKGNFERGVSTMLELTDLRARGITPQPVD
ncbi:MAG: hypothetical protein HY907_18885 [Deltaproteobacteria bacterium]|nr:hypothetical protein [Deltaproteobacteria bacterium]